MSVDNNMMCSHHNEAFMIFVGEYIFSVSAGLMIIPINYLM